jgi:hypothetical protein
MDLDQKLCWAVKKQIRERKLRIKELANSIEVSEPTLKRWLNGEGISLKSWTKLIQNLNLSLPHLLTDIEGKDPDQFEYTEEQEHELSVVPGLLAFFQLLNVGKSPEQIKEEHRLSRSSVNYYLGKLHKIGLIEWKSDLKCRVVRSGEPLWRKNGKLARAFRERFYNEFVHARRDSPKMRMAIYNLLVPDQQRIVELINNVLEFAKEAEKRAKLESHKARPFALSLIVDEYEPEFLYKIPKGRGPLRQNRSFTR